MSSGNTSGSARYRIGRYAVKRRIGKGGMGMVYQGRDEALDRDVAVKTLTVEGSLDAESRRRFEVEAKAAAKLSHPNLVTVFELGEDRGMPYIAMELLPGADLETVLRSGEELLLAEKLEVMAQVCRGLAYAHEHGVVHRDIKPSNIRLLDDGTAKIMDFGIAKLGGSALTKTGMMVGTVHYMSPEQVRGRGVDGRSDVFSTGVILYELLSGRRPFRGEGPTDILYKIVHEPAEPLDVAALGLDPRLAEVVSRALEKDVERRFPTAAEMASALDAVLRDLGQKTVPEAAAEPLSAARRLLKEGRAEEGLTRLRTLAESTPTSVEVRRALRAASREVQRKDDPADRSSSEFPELDATYRAAATVGAAEPAPTVFYGTPETRVVPAAVEAAPAPPRRSFAPVLVGAAVLGLLGLGLGIVVMKGGGAGPSASPSPSDAAASPGPAGPSASPIAVPGGGPGPEKPGAPSPSPVRPLGRTRILPVITDPAGASVSLDGQKVPGTTPLDLTLDPSSSHRVSVSLDSYATQENVVEAGTATAELRLRLEPAGPLAAVTITSTYPIDVSWRGRSLARAETSPRVQVPGGRQTLLVSSPSHFLRSELQVNAAPGGSLAVEAPALGRVSIRANPDNCQVFIDGTFVDYPPIMDKAVGAGSHVVSFKWPDGTEAKETVEVQPGKVSFVSGRKP